MFVTRSARLLRATAILAVVALLTLVTPFDFEASDLPLPANPFATTTPKSEAAEQLPATPQFEPVGEFAAPVEIFAHPNDSRFFVVSLYGQVLASDGETQTTILDIADHTDVRSELGLLGATFNPTGDRLYVHYSNHDGDSVLAEYQVDPATAIADRSSGRQVLVVDQPYDNHNGGELTFGPDGYLYAGFGDGGLADDPNRAALDLSTRLGKILRIDPEPSGDQSFTVPGDNPFVDADGADPTIWSYGLRNPWRFSFDAETDALWIADVGQNHWEEINAVFTTDQPAGRGLSFGWSAYEGDARFNEDQPGAGHTDPFFTYERADGRCSISGGTVYRNPAHPTLDGWYVYGDYCTGEILAFDVDADEADREVLTIGQLEGVVAIATGPNGDLYAASAVGPVLRLS